jgi:iron complex transport system substrate-binding protein
VNDLFGPVTIPVAPERVVALSDWYEVDYLLAVGIRPVLYGYTNRYGQGVAPWVNENGGEGLTTYDLEGAAEPDLEAISAATPDLIVADPYISEQIIDQLRQIAPTVVIPTSYSGSKDWRTAQILVGRATGREAEAAQAIADTEATIDLGREELSAYADRRVTIAYTTAYNGGSLFMSVNDSQESGIIRDLGVQSLETIQQLADVDILISYGYEDNWILEESPLFLGLPVASNGQYQPIPPILARAMFAPSTLSVRYVVPELVTAIRTAAEGNGKRLG